MLFDTSTSVAQTLDFDGVGNRSIQAIIAAYHCRFAIESGYRQLHQVRARTRSQHTGLRLLLIGLALMLVNLYVLVRARWAIITRYGSRIYRRAVTLNEVATALLVQIQSILGFSPEFYLLSVLRPAIQKIALRLQKWVLKEIKVPAPAAVT